MPPTPPHGTPAARGKPANQFGMRAADPLRTPTPPATPDSGFAFSLIDLHPERCQRAGCLSLRCQGITTTITASQTHTHTLTDARTQS